MAGKTVSSCDGKNGTSWKIMENHGKSLKTCKISDFLLLFLQYENSYQTKLLTKHLIIMNTLSKKPAGAKAQSAPQPIGDTLRNMNQLSTLCELSAICNFVELMAKAYAKKSVSPKGL